MRAPEPVASSRWTKMCQESMSALQRQKSVSVARWPGTSTGGSIWYPTSSACPPNDAPTGIIPAGGTDRSTSLSARRSTDGRAGASGQGRSMQAASASRASDAGRIRACIASFERSKALPGGQRAKEKAFGKPCYITPRGARLRARHRGSDRRRACIGSAGCRGRHFPARAVADAGRTGQGAVVRGQWKGRLPRRCRGSADRRIRRERSSPRDRVLRGRHGCDRAASDARLSAAQAGREDRDALRLVRARIRPGADRPALDRRRHRRGRAGAVPQPLAREKGVEPALRVELVQVVRAADVVLADEDLRDRAAARLLGETDARLVVVGNVDLLVGDALLLQEALGANAIRTIRGRVNLHGLHEGLDALGGRKAKGPPPRTGGTVPRAPPRKRPPPSPPCGCRGKRCPRRSPPPSRNAQKEFPAGR